MKRPEKFEEITKAPDISFKDIHPTESAGRKFKGIDLPAWAGCDGEESKFIRCPHCGFIINTKVNTPGSGWGNDAVESITIDGETANAKNPVSTAGCPFCNASNWEKK
jgi:hypothetical protein